MYVKSPLNYIGGKYKLLPDIIKLFPNEISNFVDLFGGGMNVGINVNAEQIYYNDIITELSNLFIFLKLSSIDFILSEIDKRINEYNLTKENLEGYLKLRERYNINRNIVDLYVLICYSFNNQIRFNSKGEFNMPFGKNRSEFTTNMRNNLINFCKILKEKNINFSDVTFFDFNIEILDENSLVYCDPPYLLGTATYNEKDWNDEKFNILLSFLDKINEKNIKFALSEVFSHKGKTNVKLIEWSKKYNVHYIKSDYSNCNYQLKKKNNKTVEVLITNY